MLERRHAQQFPRMHGNRRRTDRSAATSRAPGPAPPESIRSAARSARRLWSGCWSRRTSGPRWNAVRGVFSYTASRYTSSTSTRAPTLRAISATSRSTASGVSTLEGLCRLVTTISFVSRRDRAPHFRRVQRVAVLFAAREPLHLRADIARRIHQQPVGRMLDQHLVARLQQRRHRQVIRHRRARRRHHAIRVHAVFARRWPVSTARSRSCCRR